MALALKSHTPIAARSPFYIDCVPAAGSIVSAQIVATVQLGDRRSSITSMTDVKSYTLIKTDAVDGIIVFELSTLVRDFFEHEYQEWATSSLKEANESQVFFLKVVKTVTNSSTGAESPTTTYYTIKDGYANYKDGINYIPSTGETGDYPFPTPISYGTDVTIMATNCYRQIGQDSYAIVGLNMGEFDRINSETKTYTRVKFGGGNNQWQVDFTQNTNVVTNLIAAVEDSPTRYTTVQDSILYVPIGKKNMLSEWIDDEEYLRFGHFVKAADIGGLGANVVSEEKTANAGDFVDNGNSTYTITTDGSPASQSTIFLLIEPCGAFATTTLADFDVVSISGSDITIETQDQSAALHLECAIASASSVAVEYTYVTTTGGNQIHRVNNQSVLRYEILCEPKYNVVDCLFINKWGCWDSFSFVKKSINSLNTTSSSYKRSVGFVDRGPFGIGTPTYNYDTKEHQKVVYNKNANKSITVNTGFVDESFNLLLEEMMVSEKIYLIINDEVYPVLINTNSVEYKTSVNDKLINYTIDFEFAYDLIQNGI